MDRAINPHGRGNLNTVEAAHHLKLSRTTLEKYRSIGCGPPFKKLGRAVRYTLEDLDSWNNARSCTSTFDQTYQKVRRHSEARRSAV